jgi:histo-blood group ABO system transferase
VKKIKIAVLNVATGPYIELFRQSKSCISNNFFVDEHVDIFLFTDSTDDFHDDRVGIKKFYIKRRGFPGDTLFRYHYFLLAEKELMTYDYVYYIDVDMNVVGQVGKEILSDLVATHHPGFYNRPGATFENRKESTAFVQFDPYVPYYCGGFQGGKPENYLEASRQIKDNINTDGKNKIVAIWHDESHWNAYLRENPPTLALDPSYCYPEERYEWLKEFEETKKIMPMIKNEKALRGK